MPPQVFKGSAVACVLRSEPVCGESPVWSVREQALYWVDNVAGKIHRFHPTSATDEVFVIVNDEVNCLGVRDHGGLVLGLRQDFAYYNPATGQLDRLMDPEPDKRMDRFNDGKVDRRGRFWAGTMGDKDWTAPLGSLYRFDPGARVTRLQSEVICANGLGWSPDDRVFYFGESFRYVIWAYDFDPDTGRIANRRVFAEIDRRGGAFADGLTVDTEGNVWSVHNMAGRVTCYSPRGQITAIIELPVPQPTSCIFGGAHLDTLYVTTSRQNMTAAQLAQAPLSGSLFAVRPGVVGLPEPYFAG
ncbi:MAG: SMP-30/gluconolactonase/LRE family protein [Chloroflexota bacterium]|nr:SMP-30/gluconolactonase/LRE family protein [Chloroflexota bacterium]